MNKDWVLCFVSENMWAYFCEDLSTATGDDWNDTPAESNASLPYVPTFRVAYDGPFDYAGDSFSADYINAGGVPWIATSAWEAKVSGATVVSIKAGTTFESFVWLIHNAGGEVYIPVNSAAAYVRVNVW